MWPRTLRPDKDERLTLRQSNLTLIARRPVEERGKTHRTNKLVLRLRAGRAFNRMARDAASHASRQYHLRTWLVIQFDNSNNRILSSRISSPKPSRHAMSLRFRSTSRVVRSAA